MNNETKWNVFKIAMKYAAKSGWLDYDDMINRYDAALPDDLPVIPKAVGEYIKWCQSVGGVIIDAFAFTKGGITEKWIYEHGDTFARAWVLGVWRVEETEEIVKLIN